MMEPGANKPRTTVLAVILIAFSAVLAGFLAHMANKNTEAHAPVYHIASLVLVGTLALVCFAGAIALIIDRGRRAQGPGFSAYHHVWKIMGVIVLFVGVGLIAKQLMIPATYGDNGNYRAAALGEQANVHAPVYQGEGVCEECHSDVTALHAKDVHVHVQCENCHGPANQHVAFFHGDLPDDGTKRIELPKSKDLCLTCHRRLAARPANFPQIDPAEHYELVEVNDPQTPCFKCHSPHEPLFLDKKITESRLHPRVSRCGDCHPPGFDPNAELPAKHPTVFQCAYCHTQTAKDFGARPHSYLGCGVCHQYYPESESSGRIVKHRDVRFCLLCHEKRPFVTAERKPTIEWPAHRTQVAKSPEDEKKVCIDCHRQAFHMEFAKPGDESTVEKKP